MRTRKEILADLEEMDNLISEQRGWFDNDKAERYSMIAEQLEDVLLDMKLLEFILEEDMEYILGKDARRI